MNTRKIYDFPVGKVQGQLVTFLKKRKYESTVADMIAGTGLPKYQVEQTMKGVLDEYGGALKATESGELLYYFPSGMRSRTRGFGPALGRFLKTFVAGASRVLALLFKIWIVVMLVGYFVIFLAIMVLAILAAFAGSAAGRGGDRDRGERQGGGGFGAMFLVMRLFDFALRMWLVTSILQGPRQRKPAGKPFYKSVFSFVFGDGDLNADWETREKTHVISYIRSRKGVITIEELMTLTGRDNDEAQRLINRYLLEFEGEPGVTENGTLIYSFPELLRTTGQAQRAVDSVSLQNPLLKRTVPFSQNNSKTNGWIIFFNSFNLLFGSLFLLFPLTPGMALVQAGGPTRRTPTDFFTFLYSLVHNLLAAAGAAHPDLVMTIVLGIVPVAFSFFFFLIPLLRKVREDRENERIRQENLRKWVYAHILNHPDAVDAAGVRAMGSDSSPRGFEAQIKRIVDRFAALKSAEPVRRPDGSFVYRFKEIERELADLEDYRKKVDLKSFEVGKTVFDSGQ